MNKRGFSLIEVLVGIALFAIVMVTSVGVMISTLRSARKAAAVALAKTEGAYALQAMSLMIKYSDKITCNSPTSLSIERLNGDNITYSLDAGILASGSSSLTSGEVKITQPPCPAVFDCTDHSVNICFVIDNAKGQDVSDKAGVNGIMFQSQVTIVNN